MGLGFRVFFFFLEKKIKKEGGMTLFFLRLPGSTITELCLGEMVGVLVGCWIVAGSWE